MKRKFFTALILAVIIAALLNGCSLFQKQPEERPLVQDTYYYNGDQDEYFTNLAKECMQSIVEINAVVGGKTYAGSGVIIDANKSRGRTYIITNSHVISGDSGTGTPTSIVVWQPREKATNNDGNKAESLVKTGADKSSDLAIISVAYKIAHTAAVYSADELQYGQRILAIGNGLNYGASVCDGLVSNKSVTINTDKFKGEVIQISAPINSGNSGGGLYDMKARLVGINTLKAVCDSPNDNSTLSVYADSISFSIPVIKVKEYVDKWNVANPSQFIDMKAAA